MPLSEEERANLVAYLDGELDEAQAQALEAKLSLDPEARAEVDAMRQTWGLLDYLPKAAPSSDFTHRTMERLSLEQVAASGRSSASRGLRAPSGRFPWVRVLASSAAVLVAAGVGFGVAPLVFRGEQQPDTDEPLVRHLRLIEKLPYYEHVEDLDFLRKLDQPDLFGEEAGS